MKEREGSFLPTLHALQGESPRATVLSAKLLVTERWWLITVSNAKNTMLRIWITEEKAKITTSELSESREETESLDSTQ